MHLVNEAQFLIITLLFLSFARLEAAVSPAPLIVIVPLSSMYASA